MEQQLQELKKLISEKKIEEISNFIQRQKKDRSFKVSDLLLQALSYSGRIGQTPLLFACDYNNSPPELLRLLLETGVQEGIITEMLLAKSATQDTCISLAANSQMSGPSLHLLLQYCEKYLSDEKFKELLECVREDQQNCVMMAATQNLNRDAFIVLLRYCGRYADITNRLLHAQDQYGHTLMIRAIGRKLDINTYYVLIAHFPSQESFHRDIETIKSKADDNSNTAIKMAKQTGQAELFSDPAKLWKKSVKLYRDFAGGEFPENERKRRSDFVDSALPKNDDDGGCVLQ